MSLSASMWTSVSGLLSHGQKMSTVGNNIANINTVGFKGSRMDFQDILYSSIGTKFGGGQIGGGVGIGMIMNDFSQGSFETTTSALDIGISGNGFFKVSPTNSDAAYYTRAGNFSLTKDGYVVDSNGYCLQGWDLSTINRGSPTDVQLDTGVCAPKHATEVDLQVNLPTTYSDNSTDATDPFFALLKNWDATQTQALGTSQYAWTTTLSVYDEGGTMHTLTVYFDQVADDVDLEGNSNTHWEYIVTMDPNEDVRTYDNGGTTVAVPEELKGLLASGTITFNSSGQMTDMTCFTPQNDSNVSWWQQTGSAPDTFAVDLDGWVAAPVNTNGLPVICPNFSGTTDLSNAYADNNYTQPNRDADGRLVALDFGFSTSTNEWTFPNTAASNATTGLVSASDLAVPATATGTKDVLDLVSGFGGNYDRSNTAMTCYGDKYTEYNLNQDGYTFGYLSSLQVSADGIISGVYSNGKTLELYQVALYNFPSLQNLRHEGNNLYSETAASGTAVCGEANTGQFGSTESYRLEQSNVDLSAEFVNMITTQRGFQANSKTITTVDTMLETVISMKR
ncbi:flagellar hook protein FlgE [Desulfovibrio sp. OttesenSCG-928-O18]|nr:flagellar hook protein FlgE [Desulfovibrio sp. OttesenSCG-928-O18]